VDVYQLRAGDQTETQIHDLNPTQFPPVGLFWTLEVPDHSVKVELDKGKAILQAVHLPILDYGTLQNALFGGGPAPIPGSVSVRVIWRGMQEVVDIRNTDPVFGGFEGHFIRNEAQMEWTATVGDYRFVSDPLKTSSSSFAEIGSERNGSFFSEEGTQTN
jgi:hypothetical protein